MKVLTKKKLESVKRARVNHKCRRAEEQQRRYSHKELVLVSLCVYIE